MNQMPLARYFLKEDGASRAFNFFKDSKATTFNQWNFYSFQYCKVHINFDSLLYWHDQESVLLEVRIYFIECQVNYVC